MFKPRITIVAQWPVHIRPLGNSLEFALANLRVCDDSERALKAMMDFTWDERIGRYECIPYRPDIEEMAPGWDETYMLMFNDQPIGFCNKHLTFKGMK